MTLSNSWKELLDTELQKEYYQNLSSFITNEYNTKTVFPPYNDIYRAFHLIEPADVKVVIIGQDPYHGKAQANGLAFSVTSGCKIPPSLRNIYKELYDDIGCEIPDHGNLEKWAGELGYKKCILETGKKQPEAISLYKKNGYKPIPNYGQYTGIDNSVCFEKLIK